jgi:hypothetical protein
MAAPPNNSGAGALRFFSFAPTIVCKSRMFELIGKTGFVEDA